MLRRDSILLLIILLITSVIAYGQVDPGTDNLTHSWTFDDGTAIDTVAGVEG